jgi:hypothetical protein
MPDRTGAPEAVDEEEWGGEFGALGGDAVDLDLADSFAHENHLPNEKAFRCTEGLSSSPRAHA